MNQQITQNKIVEIDLFNPENNNGKEWEWVSSHANFNNNRNGRFGIKEHIISLSNYLDYNENEELALAPEKVKEAMVDAVKKGADYVLFYNGGFNGH